MGPGRGFEERLVEVEAAQDRPVGPSQMCTVAADLLGVRGAGLVMSHQHVRLPVGASSQEARAAEEVQASVGAGPCLTAEATRTVLVAGEADLVERWPAYHAGLVERTSYRSTLSFPIVYAGASFAALNLYSDYPTWTPEQEFDVVQSGVVEPIGIRLLLRQLGRLHGGNRDGDRNGDLVRRDDAGTDLGAGEGVQPRRRARVWVAVGMVRTAASMVMSEADAVAVLRGYAFRTDRLLDDVAADLVSRRLSTADVLDLSR